MATQNNRQKRSLEVPLCKYGFLCYQKNPEHHKKFRHPNKNKNGTVKDTNENFLNDAQSINTSEISVTDSIMSKMSEISQDNLNDSSTEETVKQILQSMPEDFFDFWNFCSSLKKSSPEEAFSDFGYRLVGTYDLLAKQLLKDKKVDISCHWRYFYDPPEFQTVIMKNGKQMFHIGYFRDDPSEMPSALASNCASMGPKLTLMGDNIFAAMNIELENAVKTHKSKAEELENIQKQLKEYALQRKYSLDTRTQKIKERRKKVVSNSFHGLGIVVPFKNDIGYRPLPDSDGALKNILKGIVNAKSEEQRLELENSLDEIIMNINFANDECDFGMGLELGIDLFCYGHAYFHGYILSVLPLAYDLLKRPKYASIIKAHLKDRKKDSPLKSVDL